MGSCLWLVFSVLVFGCLFVKPLRPVSWMLWSILSLSCFSASQTISPPDLLTQPLGSTVLILSLVWWIASLSCLIGATLAIPFSFSYLLCFLVSLSFLIVHSLGFYISFESCLVPMLLLLLGYGPQPERVQAAMNMVLYTVVSSLPFLALLLYSGSFFFIEHSGTSSETQWLMWVLLIPFWVKLPGYIVHLWLPKAHVEAPVTGSMLLASLLLKLGLIGLYRVSFMSSFMLSSLGCLIITGGFISLVVMMGVVDLKAVVAYCSIAHMAPAGSLLCFSGLCGSSGWVAILVAHGLVSPLMFFAATSLYSSSSSRSLLLNQGLLSSNPVMSCIWGLVCVMNISVPPLLGFLGEMWVVVSFLSLSMIVYSLLLMSVFLGIVVFTYLLSSLCHGLSLSSWPVKQDIGSSMVYFMSCGVLLMLMLLNLMSFQS